MVAGKQLENALKDESAYVQVIAAEALGKYGSKEQIDKAVETLGKIADPVRMDASLRCSR